MKTLNLIEKLLIQLEQDAPPADPNAAAPSADATVPQPGAAPAADQEEQPKPVSSEAEVYFVNLLKKALALKINDGVKLDDSDKQAIATAGEGTSENAKEMLKELADIIEKYQA